MKIRKAATSLLLTFVLVFACATAAMASEPFETENAIINIADLQWCTLDSIEQFEFSARAYGQITGTISAGKTKGDPTAFSLEMNETVTINCTFSPRDANIAIGLIAPDGNFYYTNTTGGSAQKTIQVNESGTYYFAIRNNSTHTVTVVGFVYY